MKMQHKDAIARGLIKSLVSLLDGEVKHQIVTDSYGKDERRIVITYNEKD